VTTSPQHDCTAVIMTHDVERVLADIDADHGDRGVEFLRHGVLLVLSAPCQLLILAGPEHGRTIPLTELRPNGPRCFDWCRLFQLPSQLDGLLLIYVKGSSWLTATVRA
jgi:hypothetical protein